MFDSNYADFAGDGAGDLAPPPLSVVDVELDPDRAAAELTHVTPGVAVGGGVGLLDPTLLSQAGRLDLLVVLARQAAWIEALTQRTLAASDAEAETQAERERPVLAEFAHLPEPAAMLRVALAQADARDSIREEIALALRIPSTSAAARINLAAG